MRLETILDGLAFPECPRWHGDSLYFSDMYDAKIWRLTPDGRPTKLFEVANYPAGLGWLPDGTLQVVSMRDRRLGRYDFDAAGHYARSDVFRLVVNTRAALPVEVLPDPRPGGLSAASPRGAPHEPEVPPPDRTAGEKHDETSEPVHAATAGSESGAE